MTLTNRLKQLEKQNPPQRGTWREFITGEWQPDPKEWAAFIAEVDEQTNPQQEQKPNE